MDLVGKVIANIFGFGFVIAILAFMFWRNSARWRRLAENYGRAWVAPLEQRRFQYGVLYGDNVAFNSYAGILTIGIHQNGFAVRLMRPFGLFYPPLFFPYNDVRGWNQSWYLNSKSIELQFSQTPEMKLVMPKEQVEWIQRSAGISLDLVDQSSPHNDRPNFWYSLTIILCLCSLGLGAFLIFQYLSG